MDQATEVREKIDIVSLISEYLPLKKAGRNFKTNCPFHNENTPSFVISPERQIWHCFGCGKGGDAFTFLMEYENMEFPEALRALAKKAGITIKETVFKKEEYSEKEKIFTINNLALKFYHYILTEHKIGKLALTYLLEKRKINKGIINTFELGFAPGGGSALSDYLVKKKGYKNRDLLIAGISFERNGKLYDFFRGRIIFPLFDHRGNATGFSARALSDDNQPKYLNTKETAVYHKGSMFFGLNGAKEEIKQKQDAIIVEGEFDMISLFMEGIKNVVAIKGTALTENQVNLLARFTPKAIKESIGVYDYLTEKFVAKTNKDTAEGKKEITDNLLPLFVNIANEVVKEHYLKKLSSILDISLESLLKEVEKLQKKDLEDRIIIPTRDKRTRRETLEEYLLALIIQDEDPKKAIEDNKKALTEYKFETLSLQKILENLIAAFAKKEKLDLKVFSESLSKELIQAFDTCYLFPLPKFSDEEKHTEEIKKVSKELFTLFLKAKINTLSLRIKTKEQAKAAEDVENLEKELTQLVSLLPKN
jgi:DNA primase